MAFSRFHKGFRRLRQNSFLGAPGDHFIRISSEHGKNFRSVRGQQMRPARTNRNLALSGSAACAKLFEDFRAEGFHRMPASNLSD
jgi:hypothetical protein